MIISPGTPVQHIIRCSSIKNSIYYLSDRFVQQGVAFEFLFKEQMVQVDLDHGNRILIAHPGQS